MWSAAGCTLALLALTIGTAPAAAPTTTAYHSASHPMISGTVVTVNDHQMVVDTDQGEQVTLVEAVVGSRDGSGNPGTP